MTRACVRERVFTALLKRIRGGELGPGVRLRVSEIAKEFRTSMAPVREALRELEVRRLVETRPYAESRVRVLNEAELGDLHRLKCSLEAQAVNLGSCRSRLEEMRGHLEEMLGAAQEGKRVAFGVARNAFHRCVVGSAFSVAIGVYWERVVDELGPPPAGRKFDLRRIRAVYEQMIEAIERGRDAELRRLLEELPLFFELLPDEAKPRLDAPEPGEERRRSTGFLRTITREDIERLDAVEEAGTDGADWPGHYPGWPTITAEDLEAIMGDPPDD